MNNIVRQLEMENETEISSSKIGELVMTALEKLDKVAFVRFASVYRDFQDIEAFKTEIDRLGQPAGEVVLIAAESKSHDQTNDKTNE